MIKIEHKDKSNTNSSPEAVSALITEKEQKLLTILRNVDYGEVVIIVKAGTPVHIEEIKKSIKL